MRVTRRFPLGAASLLLAGFLLAPCGTSVPFFTAYAAQAATVYEGQGDISEAEIMRFLADLPAFRVWHNDAGQHAHPTVSGGQPDFTYSEEAAAWVRQRGWEPARFFCVMGRAAAAMVRVSEGEAVSSPDMPPVSEAELVLVRRHMGELLRAGGDSAVPVAGNEKSAAAPTGQALPVSRKPAEFVDQSPRNRGAGRGGTPGGISSVGAAGAVKN